MKKLQDLRVSGNRDATRDRLLYAAASIFAEIGYQAATTRQICLRARANAAAVNYHFGDKLGLYTAVLKDVVGAQDARLPLPAVSSVDAAAALREYIRAMLQSLSSPESADLYLKLMAHELSQPTPGLSYVVTRIIRPRTLLFCELIGRLTGSSATALETRLSAHCIIGQIMHFIHARPVLKLLWPKWPLNDAARNAIAAHVSEFSLAALRGMKRARGLGRPPARGGVGRRFTPR